MRHEYVGDVGDFGKYALLNALAGEDLQLGVVWYLNASTESNNDGLFTDYTHLRSCNPVLHDQLLKIVQSQKRSLERVEAAALLPGKTTFYREPMPYSERPCFSEAARARETSRRRAWHEDAIGKLSNSELVFLDPDSGLAGTRVKAYARKSPKSTFREEVKNWIDAGKSVVLYQHQQRLKLEEQVRGQLSELRSLGCSGWAVTFHRMAVRIYFVLPTDEHRLRLRRRTETFLDTEWGRKQHFRLASD
jgi:hypothetical protein